MPIAKSSALSTRRFGIEVEFGIGTRSFTQLAIDLRDQFSNCHPGTEVNTQRDYRHSNGTRWDLKTDSSCGYELASPAMTWAQWPQLATALEVLVGNGARVNSSCGLHVHHSVSNYSSAQICRLAALWGAIEEGAFALVQPERRHNDYCMPFKASHESWQHYQHDVATVPTLRRRVSRQGRHRSLNMEGFWRRGTIEFRLHHGTLDLKEMRQWVTFTQTLVELARRRIRQGTLAKLAQLSVAAKIGALADLVCQYHDHEQVTEMAKSLQGRRIKPTKQPVVDVSYQPYGWQLVDDDWVTF